MLGLNKIHEYYSSTIALVPYLYKLYKYRKNQFLDSSELRKFQLEKLRILLSHAYNKVSYYKKLFDGVRIKPNNINSLEDLVKIPITSRRDIQGLSKKEIIAQDADVNKCTNLRTSGSTGMPLDIFIANREKLIRRLSFMRMYFANGRKIKDKVFIITIPQNFMSKKWFIPIQYKLRFLRQQYISLYENSDNILRTINLYQPDIILSYPSIVEELACRIKERNIRGISPRMMFLTGEVLTPKDREYISSVFNAEVFNYYASNESGIIAWECKEHFGYHIDSDHVIVEFIKEDGTHSKAGEEGEIVITSLNSYIMPFIRYRLGDIGIPSDEKCPCGRTLPLMKMVAGRANDCIFSSQGKKISPFYLTCEIENVPGVVQYQVIQEAIDAVKIKILKDKDFNEQSIGLTESIFKRLCGEIKVEFEVGEDIVFDYNNVKFRTVVSRLNQ